MQNKQKRLYDVEDELKRLIPKDVVIRQELYEKLIKDVLKPEGRIRIRWIVKLIREYGYDSKQIDIEVPAGVGRTAGKTNIPVRADIVVYRDFNFAEPFIVIETKAKGKKEGIEQAESYARNLGAEYHVWSNGTQVFFFKTSRYPNQSESIGNIPYWIGQKPRVEKLERKYQLPPFKNERELTEVIKTCHDLIFEREGHDPAKAFDELTKLLFLKMYDERETPRFYEFIVLANETPKDTGKRIRELFEKAVKSSRYKDVFEWRFGERKVEIELDDSTIQKIVQLLQGYSLIGTTETIEGTDIKGRVFEQMVGRTFRGELGQFFTPRTLVEFMVKFLDPNTDDKIYDPACGSGGFLIMAIRVVKDKLKKEFPDLTETEIMNKIRYFAENNIFGTDINERMTTVAKMNMIMHGDGHSGIFQLNGLYVNNKAPSKAKEQIVDGTFSIIFSNPPFAGYEKNPQILKLFELGKTGKNTTRSVTKEVLFIERIINLLKTNGKAGLVLPLGIFNNPSLKYVREYIKKHCKILGIIGLPDWAFTHTGTSVKGALLFIKKSEKVPEDYDIFWAKAEHIGYDSTGRPTDKNDLQDILNEYHGKKAENKVKVMWLKFSELEDRIDPDYYNPEYKKIFNQLKKSKYPLVPISEVVEVSKDFINPKKEPNRKFKYIETNDVDFKKGKIISEKEFEGKHAPSRAKFLLKTNDFLIPTARESLKGVVIVPEEYEGYIGTNRFLIVRPKPDIHPLYLFYILRSNITIELLKREATGEISISIGKDTLNKVKIPLPSKEVQEEIAQDMDKKLKEIEEMRGKIEKLDYETRNEIYRIMEK